MLNYRDEVPCQGYPKSLHAVTLWSIPLDDKLPKVQQEDIPSVETLPGHLHLEVGHREVQSPLRASSASSLATLNFTQPCSVPSQSPGKPCPPLQPPHSSCP